MLHEVGLHVCYDALTPQSSHAYNGFTFELCRLRDEHVFLQSLRVTSRCVCQ
jgi:hypothetical protein